MSRTERADVPTRFGRIEVDWVPLQLTGRPERDTLQWAMDHKTEGVVVVRVQQGDCRPGKVLWSGDQIQIG